MAAGGGDLTLQRDNLQAWDRDRLGLYFCLVPSLVFACLAVGGGFDSLRESTGEEFVLRISVGIVRL